jgi:hypothetical protein
MGGTISYGDSHQGGFKRGAWWVYKKYADMNGNYTLQTVKGINVEVYATNHHTGEDKIEILLGTWGGFEGLVGINIYDLTPNLHYDYNIFRLKSKGNSKVGAPENVDGNVLAADSEGTLYFEVEWQASTDCYYILIL